MKKIKILALMGLLFIFAGVAFERKEMIISYVNYFSGLFGNNKLEVRNDYTRDMDFTYVKRTTNFHPKNYQDILNIYYSALNNGLEEFTFQCDASYTNCLDEVDSLANSQEKLSDINNYVHPFNSFKHIETTYNSLGSVTISIVRAYTPEEITLLNKAVDEIYTKVVNENATVQENIKSVHDYIINYTKYDKSRKDGESEYRSDTAYGALYQGYAVCGGYADTMSLFLNKMNIPNFKASSDMHVWNVVNINGQWLNLDLTWDDPISIDGLDYLEYDFFLIDSKTMLSLEKKEHNFNVISYPEIAY